MKKLKNLFCTSEYLEKHKWKNICSISNNNDKQILVTQKILQHTNYDPVS